MWHYESKGADTVKSGYRLAVEIWRREKTSVGASTSEGNLRFLEKLCALNIPPKVKTLHVASCRELCQLGANLNRRRITNGTCSICKLNKEADRHIFFECKWVTQVWAKMQGGSKWEQPPATSVLNFFAAVYMAGEDTIQLIRATSWAIWLMLHRTMLEKKKKKKLRILSA